MYQNEADDRIVTPAHLLLMPSDPSGSANFLSFRDIGVSTLRESSAFSKIRNFSKAYSTQLVHSPSTFVSKYQKLSALYMDENSFLDTSSFGVSKQHNFASISTIGNGFSSTLLDSRSFSQFLDSSNSIDHSILNSSREMPISPLSASKDYSVETPVDFSRLSTVLSQGSNYSLSSGRHLIDFPTSLDSIDDNSDKEKLLYPSLQLHSKSFLPNVRRNSATLFSQLNLVFPSSTSTFYPSTTLLNSSFNSRVMNINGPNSKVLLNDQSSRNLPTSSLSQSNLNFSLGVNSTSSNLQLTERINNLVTPYANACSIESGMVDQSLSVRALGSQVYTTAAHPAVQTSSPHGQNSLSYDTPISKQLNRGYGNTGILIQGFSRNRTSSVGEVFIGSREKTPKSINTAYWDTFWSTTNSSKRILSALNANLSRTNFALPTFPNYVDYDFRNDQALDMLEELFWEQSFSGYNFYDYLTLNKESRSSQALTPKEATLRECLSNSNLGTDILTATLSTNTLKDLSAVGQSYGVGVQMEEYSLNPRTTSTINFSMFPFYSELNEVEDSFASFKQLPYIFTKTNAPSITFSSNLFGSSSYVSIFNAFRSDFIDFNWQPTLNLSDLTTSTPETALLEGEGSSAGLDLRLSNPATLRSSVRNSIVNSNAFQKVFKARLDEGRANVQSDSFSDLGLRQPFLSDKKVPYLQLLGKNRSSFFETPLYLTTALDSYNTSTPLTSSLNTPAYSFPFLLARTSDTTRFTWIDWFSKWKYVEVQPSSVSRYSTLGVPYFRKPFDFNSSTGDKYQDTELYFTRIARSRRNYLTNWSYSPYMYNRTYVWNTVSRFDSCLFTDYTSVSASKFLLNSMSWYWMSPAFGSNTISTQIFSSSGNEIYGKSTWRPRTSIQSFYANTSKLIDILSRREHLYRLYLAKSYNIEQLPQSLCATPSNPLLVELKSSFLFNDPAVFGSEISRDFMYGSNHFLKSLYFQSATRSLLTAMGEVPANLNSLLRFSFFYFLGSDLTANGKSNELYKSQFRPLRKGISSMLRLHATGAVAMPIEIRLQVLASSRDVIHSWAIPSAHIKIDCVPGYTSHRIMKFLLTGVYWGQCQEICGRYHHWMPIVVYFMKPDLFVLWCVHFVMSPSSTEHQNAATNWFHSPLKTTSN